MTTEPAQPNPRRRIRVRAAAVLAVAALAIGSLTLLAMTTASAFTSTAASPSASTSPSPTPSAANSVAPSAAATPTPALETPSATPTPARTPSAQEFFVAGGTEPTVAADPAHPEVLAIATQNVYMNSPTVGCSVPTIRISRDGGATWGAPIYPWAHQCQDMHVIVAWGPDSRLWAGDAVGVGPGVVSMSVTHSDDLGMSWTRPYIQGFTKAWSGAFPSMTVDNWPGSPNYGTVYVTYNWLPDNSGPAVALMASRDGTNWVHAEVPVEGLAGYPYSWRIGYRIKAAPDGTAFVSFFQADLRFWNPGNMMNQGADSNVGRRGFEIARVHFKGSVLTADQPAWATNVDNAEAQWQSALVVDDAGEPWLAVETGGRIDVGTLDGRWREFSIPGSYCFKASMAISGQTVFVGWHAYDSAHQVSTYYTLSYDGGETFLPPAIVSGAAWNFNWQTGPNGVGLRENAEFMNGVVYYAYGDARSGDAVYLARIHP
jgi:hypothetical protein